MSGASEPGTASQGAAAGSAEGIGSQVVTPSKILRRLSRTPRELVDRVPAELRSLPQWVGWRQETRDGEPTKVPVNPGTGHSAKSDDPSTWSTFEAACRWFEVTPYAMGIGFMFAASDPYVGLDFDNCILPNGEMKAWGRDLLALFKTYAEISPSGTGVKLWVRAATPERGRKFNDKPEPGSAIEVYGTGRYFTVTGEVVDDDHKTIFDHDANVKELLESLHEQMKDGKSSRRSDSEEYSSPASNAGGRGFFPPGAARLPKEDLDLIQKITDSKGGAKFVSLWRYGDTSNYPSHSEADFALCQILAWWCADDPVRIERIFSAGKLAREKWERKDYREQTIANAIAARQASGKAPYSGARKADAQEGSDAEEPFELEVLDGTALSAAPLPPLKWLAHSVIVSGSVGWIAAPPKMKKSLVALHLCVAVAAGKPFLGRFEVDPGVALYISVEDPKRIVYPRAKALAKGLGVTDVPAGLRVACAHDFRLDRPECLEKLREELTKHPAKLVVFDVFGLCHSQDQNDSKAMAPLMADVRKLARDLDTAVLIVGHFRKQQAGEGRGGGGGGSRLSGSVALHGASECSIYLSESKGACKLTFECKETQPHEPLNLVVEAKQGVVNTGGLPEPAPLALRALDLVDAEVKVSEEVHRVEEALRTAWEAAGKPDRGVTRLRVYQTYAAAGGCRKEKTVGRHLNQVAAVVDAKTKVLHYRPR